MNNINQNYLHISPQNQCQKHCRNDFNSNSKFPQQCASTLPPQLTNQQMMQTLHLFVLELISNIKLRGGVVDTGNIPIYSPIFAQNDNSNNRTNDFQRLVNDVEEAQATQAINNSGLNGFQQLVNDVHEAQTALRNK